METFASLSPVSLFSVIILLAIAAFVGSCFVYEKIKNKNK